MAGQAGSAPEPEPGVTLCSPPPRLGGPPPSEACQGQAVLAGMSRDLPPLFFGLAAPPPLSLCLASWCYHEVIIFMKELDV